MDSVKMLKGKFSALNVSEKDILKGEAELHLFRIIKWDVATTAFNFSLLGMSLWLLIGMADIPVFATLLKIATSVGSFCSGFVEQYVASKDDDDVMNYSIVTGVLITLLYSVGNIVVAFNLYYGVFLLALGKLVNGADRGVCNVYRLRVLDTLAPNVKHRNKLTGKLSSYGSSFEVIGLIANLAVMTIAQYYRQDAALILKALLIVHGTLGFIDLAVTVIERNTVKRYYINNPRKNKE